MLGLRDLGVLGSGVLLFLDSLALVSGLRDLDALGSEASLMVWDQMVFNVGAQRPVGTMPRNPCDLGFPLCSQRV